MQTKIRWGILGAARIAANQFNPALRKSVRSVLAAAASRDEAKGREFARTWGIPRLYTRYEDLLADPDIDVIYNPLPNHLHAEWTVRALQAGKHVLCEKPLVLTLDEMRQVEEAAQSSGKVAAEAFMYRHHPLTHAVQEIVASGELGEIRLLRGAFSFFLNRPDDYRWDPAAGGGSLWDVGCYPVSYFRMLTGSAPLTVQGWQVNAPSGVDASFSALLRYPGDVLAQMDSSFAAQPYTTIEVRGSKATLWVPKPFLFSSRADLFITQDGRQKRRSFSLPHLYLGEIRDMEDCILEGKSPRLSLAETRQNTAALLALYESARAQQPVHLRP